MDNTDSFKTEDSLSIVVPCYNCMDTLDRTVNSLISQMMKKKVGGSSYQILLVDDGSTDSTPQKCDEYSKQYPNISVIHKPNGGLVDAWKTGVKSAIGSYIAFCDSDDYIESDFVQTISDTIAEHHPDMIVYGMTIEYDNGEIIRSDVLLKEGFYDKNKIDSDILPRLLSNGDMETVLMKPSRCNKVFTKHLLDRIVDDIPNNISMGEDETTTFAAAINMDSIYCKRDYYPYHYVRNSESMIGAYDEKTFEKIDLLYDSLTHISDKYGYAYPDQIRKEIQSLFMLYLKKEICKNPGGMGAIFRKISAIRKTETYIMCCDVGAVKHYSFAKKVFAYCIFTRMYLIAYAITKAFEALRGRTV